MPIKMKALKSFGVPGANEGKVRRGREIGVESEGRARDLETRGLAFRVEVRPPTKSSQPQPAPVNKAAEAGPLDFPGGTTGEAEPAPSSHPARQQHGRRSKR